jgi:tetratricopeptide (TPR) repeat protein
MSSPEDIEAQRELLRVYRRNLARYLQQQAEQGGPAYVTPPVANGIVDARAEIARIKTILRGWGQTVDEHPDDEPGSIAPPVVVQPEALLPVASASPTTTLDPDGLEAYFTDVEHLRDAFRQLLSTSTLPRRMLVVHGVGGVGKSSLMRMFRIAARRATVPIALASGDEVKSVVDLLADWSDDLQAAGVRLPTSTKAIARYRAVQTTVEHQAQKTSAVAGKLAVKTAEGFAGSMAGAAIGSLFPVIGTVAGAAVGALVGTGGEALSDWLGTFLKRPDIDLLLDPTRQLTDAFLADIDKAAAQQRIVLLLDTFEQLSALEDWARDFAQRLHANVLLMIAGRGLPGWGRAWPSWMAQAHVEELKPMMPEIMRELIERYYATMRGGKPDPAQVEAIINFARGLPVVVTSAVQLWVAYGVEDFQSVKPQVVADLVDRLLEGVPRGLVPALEAAAALRWFNKDLLRAVLQQEDVNTVYDELRRFPFIRPRVEGLALHDAMREIVDENLRVNDPERHHALHECAAAYFEAQLAQGNRQATERLGLERLYHRVRADEDGGTRLFREMADDLVNYRLIHSLKNLLNDVNTYPLEKENNRLWNFYFAARLAHFEMRLGQAENAYKTISENENVDIRLQAYALRDWGNILLRSFRISQPGGEERAKQVLEKALYILPSLDINLLPAILNLCGVYCENGDYDKAIKNAQKAIELSNQYNSRYAKILSLDNLRSIHGMRGDWPETYKAQYAAEMELHSADKDHYLAAKVMGGFATFWTYTGRYTEGEQKTTQALDARKKIGDPDITRLLRELAYLVGIQGRSDEAKSFFAQASDISRHIDDPREEVALIYKGRILTKQGRLKDAKILFYQAISDKQKVPRTRVVEVQSWLAELHEIAKEFSEAARLYLLPFEQNFLSRLYFQSAALTGLVRVKHAQGDYAAIPPLLAEAEALAQQYEYNDHLTSLRLSQAQLAWDGLLPALGRGFDAALRYYQQALTYALRYNRFLLDEALWGGGVSTPLKPIIPHCIERTFEGQRMLAALRDWWQTGVNDIGTPRPDTISPIPEGIALLEAERIAREREPGDGTPQKTVLEQLALHL